MEDVLKPLGSLLATDRSKAVVLVLFLLYVFGVGVSCRILYSFVIYLYVSGSGSITSVGEESCCLLVIVWFLFGEVSSSSGCLGWATLFYCGTPWAFHIIFLTKVLEWQNNTL